MKRIYISGPMAGMDEHNFPAFHAEAKRLRELGYDIANPAEINPVPGTPRNECLRRDLAELLACDSIALLDGWQNSKGAHVEIYVADSIGMEVLIAREITA